MRPTPADRAQAWLAGAGMAAPVLFAVLVVGSGLLEPGYSHRTQTMSVLGGVPGLRGTVFNGGLALTGLLIMAFALGLHRGVARGRTPLGPLLIAVAGAGMMGSAMFHCNPDCANVLRAPTLPGRLHIVTSLLSGVGLGLAPLVMLGRFRGDPRWSHWWGLTLAMGVLSNLPGITMWVSFATVRIPQWEGVLQRLGLAAPLLWIGATALRLLIQSRGDRRATAQPQLA